MRLPLIRSMPITLLPKQTAGFQSTVWESVNFAILLDWIFRLIQSQEPAGGSAAAIRPANGESQTAATPFRDPDQPFRLAPMSEAGRSIAIPLATNLHLAFDSQLQHQR